MQFILTHNGIGCAVRALHSPSMGRILQSRKPGLTIKYYHMSIASVVVVRGT